MVGKKLWIAVVGMMLCASALALQARAEDAKQIVQQAVTTELAANRDDHSLWRYLRREAGGNTFMVVETTHGTIGRHVEEKGRPASQETLAADDQNNQKFIHDPAQQKKQKQNGEHDDKSTTQLLNLLPQAFLWKVESETPEATTLTFKPDPNFHPPNMEARVMGAMTGTLIVDHAQHRIRTMKGRLESDVTLGFGLFARIKRGSTFDVERRQVAPGYWEITETHVHIGGHALFFKTIGQQEDEVKSEFTMVPRQTTLEQAVDLLKQPAK